MKWKFWKDTGEGRLRFVMELSGTELAEGLFGADVVTKYCLDLISSGNGKLSDALCALWSIVEKLEGLEATRDKKRQKEPEIETELLSGHRIVFGPVEGEGEDEGVIS